MKRRDFFTKLGLGVIAAIAAPKLLAKEEAVIDLSKPSYYDELRLKYLTPEEVLKTWRQTGQLMYSNDDCYPSPCRAIQFLDRSGNEVLSIIAPDDFNICFWDVITTGKGHFVVSERASSYWIAKEL
jgi:hypothetical protein